MKTRSGEVIELALPANLVVREIYPTDLADIKDGSFVGVGGVPQSDGSQRAIAVTVFPESARGVDEGFRPFDLTPESTMTNATVAGEAAGKPTALRIGAGRNGFPVPY